MTSLNFDLVVIGGESGFLKLLFRRHDMRVGVQAIGEQATELVHIGLIALSSRRHRCSTPVSMTQPSATYTSMPPRTRSDRPCWRDQRTRHRGVKKENGNEDA